MRIGSSSILLLATGAAGMLAGLGLSFAVPGAYVSQAVLSLEGPPTPAERLDLIRSLAERAWPRIVLSRIIENFDLYGSDRTTSLQDAVSKMRSQITTTRLERRGDGFQTFFAIRFQYQDPAAAQKVVGDLAHRLIAENHRGEELGIPGALVAIISPATLPRFEFGSKRLLLAGEGLVLGLAVGALLISRRRRPNP